MSEVSSKQLAANRKNAEKGGVKTPEGKAVSKYNALQHGLLSQEVLLKGEDKNLLVELGQKLRAELKPETELERLLVDRITSNTWRLKRALRIEREMIDDDRFTEDLYGNPQEKTLGEALSYDFTNADTYGKFIRYETSIERGIYKALHELQRIQAARIGEKPLLPIAIDVDVADYSKE